MGGQRGREFGGRTVSAETLRRAAEQLRTDAVAPYERGDIGDREMRFKCAVANLLDFMAPYGDQPDPSAAVVRHALAVAISYLNEEGRR